MNRRALCLALLAAVGCSSARRAPRDAAVEPDAGGDADGSTADGDAGDAADAAPKPPPVSSPASRLVVPGDATLVGHGPDSCTNAPGATGDRWCAFGRAAASGFFDLWLLDVTKAASGAAVACDGTDASCIRVSQRLFKGRHTGFANAGFNGDTLIYGEAPYEDIGDDPFVGVLDAWRPGMTAGRALTSRTGRACVGHDRSDAVYCFEDIAGDGTIADVTIGLHAGRVGTATGADLPKIDTLLLAAATDAPGTPARVQYDVSPDGQYVLWSTRATASDVETLHARRLDGTSAALVVARDVSRWAVAPDGLAWYWLAGYNYDVSGAPAGTLQTAPFPAGTGPAELAASAGELGVVGAKSLWWRAEVSAQVGALRFLPDRDAPASVVTVDARVLGVLDVAGDGARFLYAKTYEPTRPGSITSTSETLTDLYAAAPGDAAPCVVSQAPAALNAALAASGGWVVWDHYDAPTDEEDGVFTSVANCASQPFATRIAGLLPAGPGAYAYLDDADPASAEATLRYAHVVSDALGAAATIQTRAAPVFAPVASAVAYTVATGTAADGLYVWVDPAPAAADGGAGDAP